MPTSALSPADPRSYIGFGFQASKGTAVAPSFFAAYVGSTSFGHNPNIRDVREAGAGQTIARQTKDFLAPGTEFAAPVRPDLAGAVLAALFGSAPAPAGVGPFTHTIVPSPGPTWLTLERNIADDIIERIIDTQIMSATFDYRKRDSGAELMMSVTAGGLVEEDQAAATVETYETDRPFLRSDCTWTIDGANPTNVESATVGIDWQFDEAMLADAVTRGNMQKLHFTGSIEVVQLFDSAAEATAYRRTHYWDGAAAGTTPGELVYPGAFTVAADYGAGADARQVQLAVPVVNWGEAELTENDPEASQAVRLTRRGVIVSNPGGEEVTATVINSRSTAYIA